MRKVLLRGSDTGGLQEKKPANEYPIVRQAYSKWTRFYGFTVMGRVDGIF